MGFGLQELLWVIGIIIVLSATGLWPKVLRGLRELRGEHLAPPPASWQSSDVDLIYRLFGLSPSARWEEVERAYHEKAKIHHPDHGGDEDAMRTLNEAYNKIKELRGK